MANQICPACGASGRPIKLTKGNLLTEIALWCLFLAPGLLYSLWRMASKVSACPQCKQPGMIPADSPRGQALMAQYHPPKAPEPIKKRRDQMTLQELIDAGLD